MTEYIKGCDRRQSMLLPDCIDDLIGPDNPVRVIDVFTDRLDMKNIGFQRPAPNITGRPCYEPRDLLKLYVYGYFNKIRSSRKLMAECTRNIELFFLLNRLTPDFRTIADFRKDNAAALKNVFRAFVKTCLELNLYQKELLAIDGSKFRAVNSKKNAYNQDILKKKLERIDDNIAMYLSQMDKEDATQQDSSNYTPEEIKAMIEELTKRKEKYESYLEELKKTDETQILTTDSEARVMQSKDSKLEGVGTKTLVEKLGSIVAEVKETAGAIIVTLPSISSLARKFVECMQPKYEQLTLFTFH